MQAALFRPWTLLLLSQAAVMQHVQNVVWRCAAEINQFFSECQYMLLHTISGAFIYSIPVHHIYHDGLGSRGGQRCLRWDEVISHVLLNRVQDSVGTLCPDGVMLSHCSITVIWGSVHRLSTCVCLFFPSSSLSAVSISKQTPPLPAGCHRHLFQKALRCVFKCF